jgi:hypothetical protein
MGWLVVLGVLMLPFILARFSCHLVVRLALLLFWLGCLGVAAWFFSAARQIEKDLETVHSYPLSDVPGTHLVTITPLSQRSMKGVLIGGAGEPPPDELKTLNWRFTDKFVPATWFESDRYDLPAPGRTPLFHVAWGGPDGPLHLEYQVGEGNRGLPRDRALMITHDPSAKHMLRDHGRAVLELCAWSLLVWGALWMTVQLAMEVHRRRVRAAR